MKKSKVSAVLLSGAVCLSAWSGLLPVTDSPAIAVAAATSPVVEYLDRGINAVGTGSGMLVSWRFLASDPDNAVFIQINNFFVLIFHLSFLRCLIFFNQFLPDGFSIIMLIILLFCVFCK